MQEDTHVRARAARGRDAAPRDPHTGRLLDGRYRIGPRIARGGMASVYEAHDTRLDRTVAVKIMHAGLGDGAADEEFAARFVREARAAAALSDPHVVAIYDQGTDETDDGSILYIVMELVAGHTLRDTITKEAPLTPRQALALLDPVLAALGAAHRAGLVHRDVKPENVLIAGDPATGTSRVKVADFGLARAVTAETHHTTNGVLIGTVSYLAPELVTDGRADARADVYAAGVILYELLTGAKPHTGESPIQVAYRHVHHDVPPPSAAEPGIPDYVDALVARATARDPGLRPSDAGVLAHQAHRVALALRDGLTSDPELVADLTPAVRPDDTAPDPMPAVTDEPPTDARAAAEPTSVIGARQDAERQAAARPDHRPRPTPAASGAEPGPPRPQIRWRRVLTLLLTMLLVVGLAGAGYWYGWGRYTSTPSLVGLSQKAAEARLDKAGLDADYAEPAYSETVEKGEVISTDPAPGGKILPDDAVTVTLSLGPERYDLPDVSGMTVDDATDALAKVKMVVGRTKERWSETVPEGSVIGTTPAYGSKRAESLPVDTAVTLVVSKGREPIELTDWTGESAAKATRTMEKAGLTVKVTERKFSESVDQGDVISQSPKSGSLYRGDVVKLVVSKGMPFVTVPSVFRMSTEDAQDKLEDLGLKVVVEDASLHLGLGVAASTNPASGTKVRKGSTITLYEV